MEEEANECTEKTKKKKNYNNYYYVIKMRVTGI